VTKQKINKKAIRKEMYSNSKEQTNILSKLTQTNPLSFEANQRLHALVARNNELQNILKPPSKSEPTQQEMSANPLEEMESTYCSNCGAPNSHNVMNGKPWCFKCNKPLIVTYKKPLQKPNQKLKSATVEEQEAFYQKQKQLHLT
jgi:hypothetical protein